MALNANNSSRTLAKPSAHSNSPTSPDQTRVSTASSFTKSAKTSEETSSTNTPKSSTTQTSFSPCPKQATTVPWEYTKRQDYAGNAPAADTDTSPNAPSFC